MELAEDVTAGLTRYERDRIVEIRDWYGRRPGAVDRLLAGASHRARWLLDRAMESDRVREATERGATRVLETLEGQLLRDVDEPSLRFDPAEPAERERALQRADERAAQLRSRYVGALSGQAAIAGAASLSLPMAVVAVAGDIAGALLGSLRTAAHTLVVYGVDRDDPALVPASVGLVAAASETETAERRATIRGAVLRLTGGVGAVPVTDEIPRVVAQQTSSRAAKEAVEQIARRMLRRRAIRVVPILGAVASASASAWLAARVAEAATHAGTVRFLDQHASVPAGEVLPTV
ncbi:MAG: EcsC family protein [Actinobacteria bacterium]|nr:EcsC family protein [Actinomycetota bacterium]